LQRSGIPNPACQTLPRHKHPARHQSIQGARWAGYLMEMLDAYWSLTQLNTAIKKQISNLLIFGGNSLTAIGCVSLVLVLTGFLDAEWFAVGISSGIRIIGSVAITGCLLSAIGYGVEEYFEK